MGSRVVAGCVLLLALSACGASAQTLSETLAGLQSNAPAVRIAAFGRLLNMNADVETKLRELFRQYPADADRIVLALFRSLELENTREHTGGPGSLTETDTEHYALLIGTVATLHDPRALNALLGAIDTGSTDGVVALGEIAVSPLVELARSNDRSRRVSALVTLGQMARRQPAVPDERREPRRRALRPSTRSRTPTGWSARRPSWRLTPSPTPTFARPWRKWPRAIPFRAPNGHFIVRDLAAEWLAKHKGD